MPKANPKAPTIGAWITTTLVSASLMAAAPVVADPAAAEPAASVDETVTFFYYDDIEAQVPFYEGLLELEKTMDEDWVKIYRLTSGSSVGLVANGRGLHAVSDDKPAMLSIVTGDVDAWYRRLVSAGVPVVSELPPEESEAGEGRAPVRGFVVTDPGGYTVEFFTWRKPVSSE